MLGSLEAGSDKSGKVMWTAADQARRAMRGYFTDPSAVYPELIKARLSFSPDTPSGVFHSAQFP
jgi:hypothetical protein